MVRQNSLVLVLKWGNVLQYYCWLLGVVDGVVDYCVDNNLKNNDLEKKKKKKKDLFEWVQYSTFVEVGKD